MRKSGHNLHESSNTSLENIFVGRRRSLSLDDLGFNSLNVEDMLKKDHEIRFCSPPHIDDTDDDLEEELPYQEESCEDLGAPKVTVNLATIRESSSPTSVDDEWSPSPIDGDDKSAQSVNPSDNASQKSLSFNMVQNYLSKWKKKIKK